MTIDQTSIIISAVSLLTGIGLSCIAIWLSIFFFSRSKDAQASTSNALTKIDTQIDQLNSINDKLLGKALTSLTQIAKQKITVENSALAAQTAAAFQAAAEISGQISTTDDRSTVSGSIDTTSNNQISEHYLPGVSDPLDMDAFKQGYLTSLVNGLNLYGWVNNYGQTVYTYWLNAGASQSLIDETENNLNTSYYWYHETKKNIEAIKMTQPEYFDNHPAKEHFEGTINRLDNLVKDLDQFKMDLSREGEPPD